LNELPLHETRLSTGDAAADTAASNTNRGRIFPICLRRV
jgi:hypothetical protein